MSILSYKMSIQSQALVHFLLPLLLPLLPLLMLLLLLPPPFQHVEVTWDVSWFGVVGLVVIGWWQRLEG